MQNARRKKLMFSKGDSLDTLIGKACEVKGDIISKETIRVDGKVEGQIKAAETVIIGENAFVKGDIEAKHIIIGGKVTGDVLATNKLEILATGELHGDIRTPRLFIAEGVIFEGTCEMEKILQDMQQIKK